jgi:hypothetical protein
MNVVFSQIFENIFAAQIEKLSIKGKFIDHFIKGKLTLYIVN